MFIRNEHGVLCSLNQSAPQLRSNNVLLFCPDFGAVHQQCPLWFTQDVMG